ncbi:MAG TPA: nucleotide exchange factor GrpE, partial [Piscirickettsiaceae bacterium]|nr:nucleotide exchange factor GrpE [Piscirickettsiaceae bacterium]
MSEENKQVQEEKNQQKTPETPQEVIEDLEAAEEQVSSDLEQALQEARRQADEHQEKLLRVMAEMETLRRRTRLDVENAHK